MWHLLKRVKNRVFKKIKLFLWEPFGLLSRFFYGNDAGFCNNFFSKRELSKIRSSVGFVSENESNFPHPILLSDNDSGYWKYQSAYDPSYLTCIESKLKDKFEDSRFSGSLSSFNASRYIIRPLDAIPELAELLAPNLINQLQEYYQSYFMVKNVRCWRNFHVSSEVMSGDVYSNLWHIDRFKISTLRVFVLLSSDVNEYSGALNFISRDNTKKIMRTGQYLHRTKYWGRAQQFIETSSNVQYFSGNFGDILVFNPQLCLHRAGVPEKGKYRDILQFNLHPCSIPLAVNWAENLPPDPEIELKARVYD